MKPDEHPYPSVLYPVIDPPTEPDEGPPLPNEPGPTEEDDEDPVDGEDAGLEFPQPDRVP